MSEDENIMILDIKDYYLETLMRDKEYMRILCRFIPQYIQDNSDVSQQVRIHAS